MCHFTGPAINMTIAIRIEDKRSKTAAVPAIEVIRKVLAHMAPKHLSGIRRIVLLDEDYHSGEEGLGRYLPVEGSRHADIEIYFDYLCSLPTEAKYSEMYLVFLLADILAHEVYHHMVRGQHRLRKASDKAEQRAASRWAEKEAGRIFNRLFSREQHGEEWRRIRNILMDHGRSMS